MQKQSDSFLVKTTVVAQHGCTEVNNVLLTQLHVWGGLKCQN